jgi:hypothetical protein
MAPIFTYIRWHALLIEEFIHLELYQDLVPQTRTYHPVYSECLLGPALEDRRMVRQTLEGIMVFRNPTVEHGKYFLSGAFVGFVPSQHAMENQMSYNLFEYPHCAKYH